MLELLKHYNEKENAKEFAQIYSFRKSSDSPRSFGDKRAREINFRIISKTSKTV